MRDNDNDNDGSGSSRLSSLACASACSKTLERIKAERSTAVAVESSEEDTASPAPEIDDDAPLTTSGIKASDAAVHSCRGTSSGVNGDDSEEVMEDTGDDNSKGNKFGKQHDDDDGDKETVVAKRMREKRGINNSVKSRILHIHNHDDEENNPKNFFLPLLRRVEGSPFWWSRRWQWLKLKSLLIARDFWWETKN